MRIVLCSVASDDYTLKKKYLEALNKTHIPYRKENVTFGEVEEENVTIIDINTIDELFSLSKAIEYDLVTDTLFGVPQLIIYDDYME